MCLYFRRDLEEGGEQMRGAVGFLDKMLSTMELGMQPPKGSDGKSNYSLWFHSFKVFSFLVVVCCWYSLWQFIFCLFEIFAIILRDVFSFTDDYAWLPSFEPDVNRRQLPPTFPRKTKLRTRMEGLSVFKRFCSKLAAITVEIPNQTKTIEDTLVSFFAKLINIAWNF